MLNKTTFKFLKELKLNNSKVWFEENRESYENTKNDILVLTQKLIEEVSDFDKTITNAFLDPKKCITRINRDLRFSKDKTPHKTDYYIVLNKKGKNSPSAFYYLHIEPGNCFVGGGVYNPPAEELKKIRKEISFAFEEWTQIINKKSFKENFPSGINNSGVLNKVPKDFDVSDKAEEFLKMKGFFTSEKLTDSELTSEETFKKIIHYFKTTKPLVDFLNHAIENN